MHPENNIYIIVYNRAQLTAGERSRRQMHTQTHKDVFFFPARNVVFVLNPSSEVNFCHSLCFWFVHEILPVLSLTSLVSSQCSGATYSKVPGMLF